tara:strand:+ start:285 stop:554 length:270 start_codon:yes stop_codon:yes gene_type:complete
MNTPQTETILSGLKQLPSISESTAEELTNKLRRAEIAIQEAQERFNQAQRELADEITEEGNGWTFEEIWKTDLRFSFEVMSYLRLKGFS